MSEPTELLWVDCEMTGLDLTKDCIIEYAAIVTDGQLKPLDEGISFVIKADKSLLDGMDEWCTKQHGESGLTTASLESSTTLSEADQIATDYARKHIPEGRILLAGSSVHVYVSLDLKKDFPLLSQQLHYRVLDVSSIKEVARRWYPEHSGVWKSKGESAHRALDDIQASINELKRYRRYFFKDIPLIDEDSLSEQTAEKLSID
ncbi:oligoribonuclease [Cystobasidium minutum MCA 4210]|uniref:oligoribonuclease n=1 Tax=Cystobasidium minutum MCA 4210 TaxID=1397322 RepID=UPI0034CD7CF2|eukprot:jgi/Rhomi1/150778/estExt_Genewise1.C_2_t40129